jgi:hypothetical protein
MKIKAYNTEDFEKQYYANSNNSSPHITFIELETDDAFWDTLIRKEAEKQMNQMFPNVDTSKVLITEGYCPEFGNIKRYEIRRIYKKL